MKQFAFEGGEAVMIWSAGGALTSSTEMFYMVISTRKLNMSPVVELYSSINKVSFLYPENDVIPLDENRFDEWVATYPHGKNERAIAGIRKKFFEGEKS